MREVDFLKFIARGYDFGVLRSALCITPEEGMMCRCAFSPSKGTVLPPPMAIHGIAVSAAVSKR